MAKEYKQDTQLRYAKRLDELLNELPRFCKTYFDGKRKLSKVTATSYAYNLRLFFIFLAKNNSYCRDRIKLESRDGNEHIVKNELLLGNLEYITPDDIDEFASYMEKHGEHGNSKDTVEHYLSALSSMWKFFIKRKQLSYNPVDSIERQKPTKKEIIRLTSDEKDAFLDAVEFGSGLSNKQLQYHKKNKDRDYAIYKVFLSTGVRISELAGMDLSDIDFTDKSIKVVRKGGNQEIVYFSDSCEEALKSYLNVRSDIFHPLDEEQALFLSASGKRLSVRAIQELTKKYVRTSLPGKKEKVTSHKLRSTYATDILLKTGNIKKVSKALGHKNVTTAEKYADYFEDELKEIRNLTDE